MVTCTEIHSPKDRPRDIRNPRHISNRPKYRMSYFGLSIVFVLNIKVRTQKILFCNTALWIKASPRTINVKADPRYNSIISKESEQKMNQHAHSTRDQNTGQFSKRKIKEISAIDPKQGYVFGASLSKKS